MEKSNTQKLLEKTEEILKNSILVCFSSKYYGYVVIIAQDLYIYQHSSGFGSEELRGFTVPDMCERMIKSSKLEKWYICPLEYKEMVINSWSVAQAIIEEKFKNNTLRKKYDEIIKDHVILRFPGNYFQSHMIATSELYIAAGIKADFEEEDIINLTIDTILEHAQYSTCIYYICPPEYKEIMITNRYILEEIVKEKFKDSTLNKLYEEIK